jgi:hypothetical protein
LKMEVQLWMLDEGMMKTMFLVAMAMKSVVQQWTLADGVIRAMSVETPRKTAVQLW